MQNDYAEARAKKLATLYKAEILHDIEMLKKPWTDDNGGPSTDNDPFHPEAKANLALANGNQTTQEHTLGWLEQYASTYLDPDEYSLINELVNSGDLFKIRHLRSWKDVRFHEDSLTNCVDANFFSRTWSQRHHN